VGRPHGSATPRTGQRVDLVCLSDPCCPGRAAFLVRNRIDSLYIVGQQGSAKRRGGFRYRGGAIRLERPTTSCRRAYDPTNSMTRMSWNWSGIGGRGTREDNRPGEALSAQYENRHHDRRGSPAGGSAEVLAGELGFTTRDWTHSQISSTTSAHAFRWSRSQWV
jgi:hypothetical protein